MVRPRTPLMLLPAMGCDGQLWARQIVDLAAVAQVDFGDLSQDDTLSEMAARVLASAPPRFAVAGVSLGGYVAMEMVRQAPDRIERIALFGTRASMEVRPRTVVGQGLLAQSLARGQLLRQDGLDHALGDGGGADVGRRPRAGGGDGGRNGVGAHPVSVHQRRPAGRPVPGRVLPRRRPRPRRSARHGRAGGRCRLPRRPRPRWPRNCRSGCPARTR